MAGAFHLTDPFVAPGSSGCDDCPVVRPKAFAPWGNRIYPRLSAVGDEHPVAVDVCRSTRPGTDGHVDVQRSNLTDWFGLRRIQISDRFVVVVGWLSVAVLGKQRIQRFMVDQSSVAG